MLMALFTSVLPNVNLTYWDHCLGINQFRHYIVVACFHRGDLLQEWMGSDHSRSAGGQSEEERPPDYYELLQIDEEATEDELRVRDRSFV